MFSDEEKFESLKKRFFLGTEKTDTCWLWNKSRNKKGYGHLLWTKSKGNIQAHRASWLIHFGEIPNGLFVLHICDNPPCVNPNHLKLGKASDNTNDMMNKGRHKKSNQLYFGEKVINAKITNEIARNIKQDLKSNMTISEISKKYNISKYIVFDIKRGKTWKKI